jgi:hypothetical protein
VREGTQCSFRVGEKNNGGVGLIFLATVLLSEVGLRINVLVAFPKRKNMEIQRKSKSGVLVKCADRITLLQSDMPI